MFRSLFPDLESKVEPSNQLITAHDHPTSLSLQSTWNCHPLESSQLQPVGPLRSVCLLPCTRIKNTNTVNPTKRRTGPHFGRLKRGRRGPCSDVLLARCASVCRWTTSGEVEEVELECTTIQRIEESKSIGMALAFALTLLVEGYYPRR